MIEIRGQLSFLLARVEKGHGISHAIAVLNNAKNALDAGNYGLDTWQNFAIAIAALVHDADDRKIFPEFQGNAKRIATTVLLQYWPRPEEVEPMVRLIENMIGLVSASQNKEVFQGPEWMTIPRDADRLEALGWIGVQRTYGYCRHIGTPLFTSQTPRVTNEDDLARIATPQRFRDYSGNSASMIDHFYDKLVHCATLQTTNPWLIQEAAARRQVMVDFLFHFGHVGTIDERLFASQ